jgi:hypothetical protein
MKTKTTTNGNTTGKILKNEAIILKNKPAGDKNNRTILKDKTIGVKNNTAIVKNNTAIVKNEHTGVILLLALAPTQTDFIPHPDGDFDEWQKNIISHLSNPWDLGGGLTPILREYLGISNPDWTALLNEQTKWNTNYAKGGKEVDRKGSDIIKKTETRIEFEKMIRQIVGQYIRKNPLATTDIKRALKLTVPDVTPTRVHPPFETAPFTEATPLGGAKIKFRNRTSKAEKRGRMIEAGALLEGIYIIQDTDKPAPKKHSNLNGGTLLSKKALFTESFDTEHEGRILYFALRWIDPVNKERNGPYTRIMSVVIA